MLIWTFGNVGSFVRVWVNYTQKRRDERLNCIGDLSLEHQTEYFSQQSAGLRGDGVVISWQRGWTCGHYWADIKDARPQEHWHTLFLSLFVTFLSFYLYHVSYIICSHFSYIISHLSLFDMHNKLQDLMSYTLKVMWVFTFRSKLNSRFHPLKKIAIITSWFGYYYSHFLAAQFSLLFWMEGNNKYCVSCMKLVIDHLASWHAA